MRHCKKCYLPETVPNSKINQSNGICYFCSNMDDSSSKKIEEQRKTFEADLEKTIQESRNQAEYDCLVPLSGGKDSLYLLYKLKVEYGLKVLAFTTNANIPELAWKNIHQALKKLDIDHISYTPSPNFYKKLFRYLLQNQEERGAVYTISYVYAPLFEGDAIQLALTKKIPLILAGYSPGQPDPQRMHYEFSRQLITQTDWCPPALKKSGFFLNQELNYFFNPLKYPSGTQFPRYLAPYHAWTYNQQEIISKVAELGLVQTKRYANPILTNYPINWLLMYSDLIHFGYNPYHPEFSQLIREGKASKMYWQIMAPFVNFMIRNKVFLGHEVTKSLNWLNLHKDDLKITQPLGAYDPY